MKAASLRYLDTKFQHPSPRASPPTGAPNSSGVGSDRRKTKKIKLELEFELELELERLLIRRLAIPATAGLLVFTVIANLAVMVRGNSVFVHRVGLQ